jgi:MFS family permease
MMGFAGLSLVIVNASINTLVQTIADEDKRGRALSLLMMCFLGMAPVGGLLFGWLASLPRLGPRWTVVGGVAFVAVAMTWFAWQLPRMRKYVRPIYERRGILPAIAQGLETEAVLSAPPEQAG